MDSQSWLVGRHLYPVDERDPRPGVVREEQVAVEVEVVAEAPDLRGGADPEARLDHAAEHDAQAERPSGMSHAHGFPDPAALRQLDVDPVRPLGAPGDG